LEERLTVRSNQFSQVTIHVMMKKRRDLEKFRKEKKRVKARNEKKQLQTPQSELS
jgi:hypothetical protein